MGYELRRQLREALGPDITGLQRAVALEIADDANERTRESYALLEDLARWTAAKDTNVVRNALKRLAASGWELRVPIGKGRDGRALYAVPGRRMTFRIPRIEGVATATPKEERGLPHGVATATPYSPEGVAVASSGVAGAPSEGAGATPFSSDSSDPSRKLASGKGGARAPKPSPAIPEFARPLVDRITHADVLVRWGLSESEWFQIHSLIKKSGVEAMAAFAVKVAGRTPVESARYFLPGWRDLPPQPEPDANGRPPLRAVSGGYQPYRNPTDQSVYDEEL
ncbi:hypothetical protein ABTZ58_10150 [Streptomyces sp. NPDC094143]|uniref:hypothetical protein n=1 Tax=Streptomyces sp. NPDC094143 TaxID=3155310 RepID=UPI003331E5B6